MYYLASLLQIPTFFTSANLDTFMAKNSLSAGIVASLVLEASENTSLTESQWTQILDWFGLPYKPLASSKPPSMRELRLPVGDLAYEERLSVFQCLASLLDWQDSVMINIASFLGLRKRDFVALRDAENKG